MRAWRASSRRRRCSAGRREAGRALSDLAGTLSLTTERGQVVIPADIRSKCGLSAGTQVEFVERWEAIKAAIDLHRQGFDFADALHWARKLALGPEVFVPGA